MIMYSGDLEWKRLVKMYDQRHGGPFDRGMADSYYRRGCNPHYFTGDTYNSPKVEHKDMNEAEIQAYLAGYEWNAEYGDHKEWA